MWNFWPISSGGGHVAIPCFFTRVNTTIFPASDLCSGLFGGLTLEPNPPTFAAGNLTPSPVAGTIGNLMVVLLDLIGDASMVVTIMVNGVDTGVSVTIPPGSPAGLYTDLVHTAPVAVGDTISIHYVNPGGSNADIGNGQFTITT